MIITDFAAKDFRGFADLSLKLGPRLTLILAMPSPVVPADVR